MTRSGPRSHPQPAGRRRRNCRCSTTTRLSEFRTESQHASGSTFRDALDPADTDSSSAVQCLIVTSEQTRDGEVPLEEHVRRAWEYHGGDIDSAVTSYPRRAGPAQRRRGRLPARARSGRRSAVDPAGGPRVRYHFVVDPCCERRLQGRCRGVRRNRLPASGDHVPARGASSCQTWRHDLQCRRRVRHGCRARGTVQLADAQPRRSLVGSRADPWQRPSGSHRQEDRQRISRTSKLAGLPRSAAHDAVRRLESTRRRTDPFSTTGRSSSCARSGGSTQI